ncbi:cytochrome P450 [Motilibacter aurantiacus]|uniref:cytochrome P450 n=1 Tax=Motilibacter aurantiacus TaxID=2714955 RepID=UPI00140C4D4B|nr:cytochrome P450 [Motilibacter aurantiacus]NHC47184.1 cytochrome P450 [Motilibacter aurantiacus]
MSRGGPRADRLPDSTLALLAQGYGFLPRRLLQRGRDVAQARLLLQRTILLSGREAARLLYDPDRFVRRGGMPLVVQRTLLGVGGVQSLDGEAFAARKAMFLSFLGPERAPETAELFTTYWRAALVRWQASGRVTLLDEAAEVLCRTACTWAGVPLPEQDVRRRTVDLRALIDCEGDPRLGYARSRLARRRCEAWAARLVDGVRQGALYPGEGTALHTVAGFRGPGGELLDLHTAAVELLNVLRPTVAISRYVVFAALALHGSPQWEERLRDDDEAVLPFVQEVRRYYPFFPAIAARVRTPFRWRGVDFPRGRRVMLDVHGTNHDPRSWESPEEFRPQRFGTGSADAYSFVPQGGGNAATGHRCPGEWVTVEVLAAAVRLLTREMEYAVPPQDLRVSSRRLPTGPRSGFVITGVRALSS